MKLAFFFFVSPAFVAFLPAQRAPQVRIEAIEPEIEKACEVENFDLAEATFSSEPGEAMGQFPLWPTDMLETLLNTVVEKTVYFVLS